MLRKALKSLILILFTIPLPFLSYASEGEIIMKMLLQKGIITESEYDQVMEELKGSKSLDQRVSEVEKKTSDIAEKQEESSEKQKAFTEHVDKHIIHAEEVMPTILNGLTIGGGVTIIGQGTSGNDDNDPPVDDVLDGNISADLEISAKIGEHGEAFLGLEVGDGAGLEGDEINTYWGVNADADVGSTVELIETWYEHSFHDGMVTFTIGKLDLTNYFDQNEVANDETTQFLSGGFVNDITIEFPDNSAGFRLTVSPLELLDVSIGAQSDGWEDIDEMDFFIAEADIKPKFGELRSNYRLYVWQNRGDHTNAHDSTETKEHGFGYGISMDQQITDFLTLFVRAGFRDDDLSEYEYYAAWSGGLALSGSLWGREDDVIGIAYGEARLSDSGKNSLRTNGTTPTSEGHFESYYSIMLNEHAAISPDIQIVTNAQGDDNFETVLIGALRGQFTF